MITFVIGGAKSGKSDHAMSLLEKAGEPQLFVPTGKALDLDFRARIADHRAQRNPSLMVREASLGLPHILEEAKGEFAAVLVDALDYWLFASLQTSGHDQRMEEFETALSGWGGSQLILVSSETGLGTLPGNRETLDFARELGRLNQLAAGFAHEAHLVVAGLSLALKEP